MRGRGRGVGHRMDAVLMRVAMRIQWQLFNSPGGRPAMEASASACGSTISPTVSPATISPGHRASTEVGVNVSTRKCRRWGQAELAGGGCVSFAQWPLYL